VRLALVILALLLLASLAFGYDEQGPDQPFTMKEVADAYGYSTIPVNPDMFVCIQADSTDVRCLTLPPGSLLLIPHSEPAPADSTR